MVPLDWGHQEVYTLFHSVYSVLESESESQSGLIIEYSSSVFWTGWDCLYFVSEEGMFTIYSSGVW